MDAPVRHQSLQRHFGDLPPERIESGDHDRLGGFIHHEVHARDGFEGSDVPSLSPNDAALHAVVRDGDDRDGGFSDIVAGNPLDGPGNDFLRLTVGGFFGLLLDTADHFGGVEFGLFLYFK